MRSFYIYHLLKELYQLKIIPKVFIIYLKLVYILLRIKLHARARENFLIIHPVIYETN